MAGGAVKKPVAVLGGGTMGHGVAQVAAQAGYPTRLYDVDPDAADRALRRIRRNLDKGVDLGKVQESTREKTLSHVQAVPRLEDALDGVALVVEAVPEKLSLKSEILRRVEPQVAESTVLATNTSSLSVDALAEGLQRPGRFLGLHFFNPVHIMALVEVVRGSATEPDVLERALHFVREIGKEPVVVKDSPGFASSRLGVALGLEAMRMVEEGVAEAEDIDRVLELGYRHPMGPLKLSDLVGLDVRLGIAEYLHGELGQEHFRPPKILRRMVQEGRLGRKSGEGFYRWED